MYVLSAMCIRAQDSLSETEYPKIVQTSLNTFSGLVYENYEFMVGNVPSVCLKIQFVSIHFGDGRWQGEQ